MINEKKVETYFSVLKDFTYNSIFSFIRLWIPRLIPLCGLRSQHSFWHLELLRMHSLMNWIEKDKFRKKSRHMEKKENNSYTNYWVTNVLIHHKLRKYQSHLVLYAYSGDCDIFSID